MAGPWNMDVGMLLFWGSCDKDRIGSYSPSSFPFPSPFFSPNTWSGRVRGMGEMQPSQRQSQGGREGQGKEERNLPIGMRNSWGSGAALQTVRILLPGRGEVQHHGLWNTKKKKKKKGSVSTGSWIKCNGHPFSTSGYILALKNVQKLAGTDHHRTLPIFQSFPLVKELTNF